ncbi:MAG: histidine phosphatase family protein [Chloroflexota bacterium]|nr:MAG: histidine phosphatase family protein [Chloroflexota bacterium]
MAVYLVRHGETSYELAEERRLRGGMRDWMPLTPRGVEQAQEVAERLRSFDLTLILSSPMTRALQTAAVISRIVAVPIVVEFDLHEWLPDTTGTYDSTATMIAAAEERDRLGGEWPPGGDRAWEPESIVRQRTVRILSRYTTHRGLAVVCHGTIIRILTGRSAGNCEIVEWESAPA